MNSSTWQNPKLIGFAACCQSYAEKKSYLFAYFTGNATAEQHVCFAISDVGVDFTPVNGGKPLISSDTIAVKKAVRDPHILHGNDGWYYMVLTDMDKFEAKKK